MTSIDMETLFTILYVRVDDWYQADGQRLVPQIGRPPRFSVSEMLTLMLAEEYLPFASERTFVAFIRANYGRLFPRLLDHSQYNRRARGLAGVLEALRQQWLWDWGLAGCRHFLLDTKPVPVVGYKRSKRHSAFCGSAAYGYCASRALHYFGYKLVLLSSRDGIPVSYELVAANTDERQAAETVLDSVRHSQIVGDKGFLGVQWQEEMQVWTGNGLLTPKRHNQHQQHPAGVERYLNAVRERIEGVFHELQNTGRHVEHLLAKTISGVARRLMSKMAAHLLKQMLRREGIDVASFEVSSPR